MIILCCGNRDRGDDAAGLLVADHLRELGIPAETFAGEATTLLERWSGAQDVLVIDAVVTGAPAGTIHSWNAPQMILSFTQAGSTHGLGLAAAVELSRTLKKLPRRLHICGIEAKQFELGTHASDAVQRAAEVLADKIAVEYGTVSNPACH